MTQPNMPKLGKQKLQKFQWSAWFPYPSSLFRAIILVPIAFPGARLIVFGFGLAIISAIGNSLALFILSVVFGLLIPTIILSFIYHFFWFIWQQQHSSNSLPKWIPRLKSLWEGCYATVVMGLSFLLIIAIFAGLGFLSCKFSYETAEQISRCAGSITGRAFKIIFNRIEKNDFVSKPWFAIWFVSAVYLYQAEYLVRKRLIPQLKYKLQKYQSKRKAYRDDRDVELDRLRGDMGLTVMKKGRTKALQTIPNEHSQRKSQNIAKKLLLILFIPLIAVIIYLFSKLPELMRYQPQQKVVYRNGVVTPSPVNSQVPALSLQSDTFREGVNKAISAANLTQLAKSQDEWKAVESKWQEAITLMNAVSSDSPNYAVAQQKIVEYQRNLSYAKKNAVGGK